VRTRDGGWMGSIDGRVVDRKCRSAEVRKCGSAEVRKCGSAEVRKCGSAEERKSGRAEVRKCGSAEVRKCGSAEVRKCGSAEVRTGSARGDGAAGARHPDRANQLWIGSGATHRQDVTPPQGNGGAKASSSPGPQSSSAGCIPFVRYHLVWRPCIPPPSFRPPGSSPRGAAAGECAVDQLFKVDTRGGSGLETSGCGEALPDPRR
jgi:hypothetical protein